MGKATVDLFRALRANNLERARKAYDRGANVNWPLDRWMVGGRQHWGLRVRAKPFGLYLGFSVREAWKVPDGEGVDRGDTLLMVALKCRMQDAVIFLVGCDRYNPNCTNEAGNTAADIARATGQEFLMRGGAPRPVDTVERGESSQEVLPAWEQGAVAYSTSAGSHGGIAGAEEPRYADVVAEAVPVDLDVPSGGGAPMYVTAEPLVDTPAATQTAAVRNPVGPAGRRRMHNPYDPTDGGGRANIRHGVRGLGVYGAF